MVLFLAIYPPKTAASAIVCRFDKLLYEFVWIFLYIYDSALNLHCFYKGPHGANHRKTPRFSIKLKPKKIILMLNGN